MRSDFPTRGLMIWATLAGLLGAASGHARAQYRSSNVRPSPVIRQAPAPIERRPPLQVGPARGALVGPNPGGVRDPKGHLGQWMAQHSSLSPSQQQQALEREPGFRQLPAEQQQHMRERLSQLNAMSPQQRQRTIEHNEAMERLTPEQRGQVRGAMSQLGSLPPDQRRMVARSFRELRQLPPDQRYAALNSGRYVYLTPTQRGTLDNLIRVAPMLPPPDSPEPR